MKLTVVEVGIDPNNCTHVFPKFKRESYTFYEKLNGCHQIDDPSYIVQLVSSPSRVIKRVVRQNASATTGDTN